MSVVCRNVHWQLSFWRSGWVIQGHILITLHCLFLRHNEDLNELSKTCGCYKSLEKEKKSGASCTRQKTVAVKLWGLSDSTGWWYWESCERQYQRSSNRPIPNRHMVNRHDTSLWNVLQVPVIIVTISRHDRLVAPCSCYMEIILTQCQFHAKLTVATAGASIFLHFWSHFIVFTSFFPFFPDKRSGISVKSITKENLWHPLVQSSMNYKATSR